MSHVHLNRPVLLSFSHTMGSGSGSDNPSDDEDIDDPSKDEGSGSGDGIGKLVFFLHILFHYLKTARD